MLLKQCVILVGGHGTRLGDLTQKLPKPLLPVGGRPFIDFLIDEVTRRGINEIICLAGYRADEVQDWARRARRSDIEIKVVAEQKPLGTAGALVAAKGILDDEFLLLNGDSFFDINLIDFIGLQFSGKWLGIVALRLMSEGGRYGIVELEGDKIRHFAERSSNGNPCMINAGVYRLKRKVLDLVTSVPCSIERDVFPALAKQELLRGHAYDDFFLDIGIPQAYKAAQFLLPAIVRRPALFLDRDGVVNRDIGYAYRPDQIKWVDGIFDAVKAANDVGTYVFIVTNQAGIARGLYDEEAVVRLHNWMKEEFRARGAYIDDCCYCPHHPSSGSGLYRRSCDCRKPAPGMLLELARKWRVDLAHSLLVGDRDTDIKAAHNAGVDGVFYNGGSVRELIDSWLIARQKNKLPSYDHGSLPVGGAP